MGTEIPLFCDILGFFLHFPLQTLNSLRACTFTYGETPNSSLTVGRIKTIIVNTPNTVP